MSEQAAAPASPEGAWPSVEILLLNWNGRALLEMCLPPLAALDYPDYQLVLLDNASTDESVSFVREQYPEVKTIVNRENLGFSRGMNVGLRQSRSEIVVLLNNDVVVRPDWLKELVRPLVEDKSVGITGSKLLFPDGQAIQHAGATQTFPLATSHHYHYGEKDVGQADTVRDVDYVTGAAMAIARRVITDVGLFDEGFSPFYFEEADLCRRTRAAGYRILYVPTSVAIHHESASIKQVDRLHSYTWLKNRLRFVLKHYSESQFLDEFVPAEIERLGDPKSMPGLRAVRRVYLEAILALPEILSQYGKAHSVKPIQAALVRLREAALAQRPAVDQPQQRSPLRAELEKRQVLNEFEFSSNQPIIGPALAAVRRAWNEVSTKWYVRAIIQQQMAFNALVARLLDEQDIQGEASANDISLLAAELINMRQEFEKSIVELRQEMDQLQLQLKRIEQTLAAREETARAEGLGQASEAEGKSL
jgi:GT2 family glycosyltransferase